MIEIQKHLNLLGYEVKDVASDYQGIVISMCFDLFGCVQADVRPKELDKDGKIKQGAWLDVNRLKVISKKPVMDQPEFVKVPNGPAEKPCMMTPLNNK